MVVTNPSCPASFIALYAVPSDTFITLATFLTEVLSMTKHEQIIAYIESLNVCQKISVRKVAKVMKAFIALYAVPSDTFITLATFLTEIFWQTFNDSMYAKVAKVMKVSEGTAYRAIKDAGQLGLVTTIDRVGTKLSGIFYSSICRPLRYFHYFGNFPDRNFLANI
jgi:hypothetical protein